MQTLSLFHLKCRKSLRRQVLRRNPPCHERSVFATGNVASHSVCRFCDGGGKQLESDEEVQDLKFQLEKAKKQVGPLAKKLQEFEEHLKKLQSILWAFDAKSKQDGENSSKERYIRHEEGARTVVENEVQHASLEAEVACESLSTREMGELHI